MSSIDQQFVEFIVKSLVSNPDAVEVTRTIDEKGVLLEEVWDYLNNFMKNVLEQFNLSIQRE